MPVIKTFKHKGLKKFYESGNIKGVAADHVKRLRLILARLDASSTADDMSLPGLGLHQLKGALYPSWSVSVSGNWRVVFRFENGNAYDVNYLDYH
jgi:proteic killer suppression protein